MRQKQLFAVPSAIFGAGLFILLTGCAFVTTSKSEPAFLAQSPAPTPAPAVPPATTTEAQQAIDARVRDALAEIRAPEGLDTTNPAAVTDPDPASPTSEETAVREVAYRNAEASEAEDIEAVLDPASPTSDETAVREVAYRNAEAMGAEDMEAVLQTVSPACAGDGEAIEIVRGLFQNYDLQYEIEELQNINVQGTEASLEVVQVTRKVAGPEFRDNRMRISHTLVKEDGEWKMCSSTFLIEDIEFLN